MMKEEFDFTSSYRITRFLQAVILIIPAVLLGIFAANFFHASDNGERIFWILSLLFFIFWSGVMIKVFNNTFGKLRMFYKATITPGKIALESGDKILKISINEISKIKRGRNILVIYINNKTFSLPLMFSGNGKNFVASVRSQRPDIEYSYYWPFSGIKPYN